MLLACASNFKKNKSDHLSLVEISYNYRYMSSIRMTPYEPCPTSSVGFHYVGERPRISHIRIRVDSENYIMILF